MLPNSNDATLPSCSEDNVLNTTDSSSTADLIAPTKTTRKILSEIQRQYGESIAERVQALSPNIHNASTVISLTKELIQDTIPSLDDESKHGTVEDYPSLRREASERALVQGIAVELVEHVPPPNVCSLVAVCCKNVRADLTKMCRCPAQNSESLNKVRTILQITMVLACVYVFLIGLQLMGDAFKAVAGDTASGLLGAVDDPFVGLMIGIVVTALVQSSSTSTSIVVTMVGSRILSVRQAIPIILGTNIGTSMTSTAVSLTFANDRENYRRGFAGAILHGVFNVLTVGVFFLLEVISDAINAGNGGALELFTAFLLGDEGNQEEAAGGGGWTSPFAAIVKPITSLFLQVDKRVLGDFSLGRPNATDCSLGGSSGALRLCDQVDCSPRDFETPAMGEEACEELSFVTVCSSSGQPSFLYCSTPGGEVNGSILDAARDFYDQLNVLKGGVFFENGIGAATGGIVTLLVSLVLLLVSLIVLVKVLQGLLLKTSKKALAKRLDINGYLAILLSTGVTILFQSSSVTTSILTPLVAIGIISLNTMLPFCIGANIGTTVTALIAAASAAELVALQIALCHLFINVGGAILWYPIPRLRRIPKRVAKKFGDLAADYVWFPPLVLSLAFGVYPMLVIGLAILLQAIAALAITLIVLIILLHFACGWWMKYGNGTKYLEDHFKLRAHAGEEDPEEEVEAHDEEAKQEKL